MQRIAPPENLHHAIDVTVLTSFSSNAVIFGKMLPGKRGKIFIQPSVNRKSMRK
jgi:hypothetical protein